MTSDFLLEADPLSRVEITPANDRARAFLNGFGAVDQVNASVFIHAAQRAGFSVKHYQGSIPEGMSLRDWHDEWDRPSRG